MFLVGLLIAVGFFSCCGCELRLALLISRCFSVLWCLRLVGVRMTCLLRCVFGVVGFYTSAVCGCLLIVLFVLVLGWHILGFVLLLDVFVRLLVIVLFGLFTVGFPVVCALWVVDFG